MALYKTNAEQSFCNTRVAQARASCRRIWGSPGRAEVQGLLCAPGQSSRIGRWPLQNAREQRSTDVRRSRAWRDRSFAERSERKPVRYGSQVLVFTCATFGGGSPAT